MSPYGVRMPGFAAWVYVTRGPKAGNKMSVPRLLGPEGNAEGYAVSLSPPPEKGLSITGILSLTYADPQA